MLDKNIKPIFVSGDVKNNNVYLSSGIQPPTDSGSFLDQLEIHNEFQSYASGGSVFHINLTDTIVPKLKNKFIKNLFENHTIRYASLTPVLSVCQNCGTKEIGKKTVCRNCNSTDISIWSRPVGYLRPVVRGNLSDDLRKYEHKYWTDSRLEEFRKRKTFDNNIINYVN